MSNQQDSKPMGEPTARDYEELAKRVQALKNDHSDSEAAHIDEDLILMQALDMIASGCDDPQAVARKALETEDIIFERWYA